MYFRPLGEPGINQLRHRLLLPGQQSAERRESFFADNLQHLPAVRLHGLGIALVLTIKGKPPEFTDQLGLIIQSGSPGNTPVASLSAEQHADVLLLCLLIDSLQPVGIFNEFIRHLHNIQPLINLAVRAAFGKVQQAGLNVSYIIDRLLNIGTFIRNPFPETEPGKAVNRIGTERIERPAAVPEFFSCEADDRAGIQTSA
ncbi:hypothetical protein D3C75_666270 [compost metagenome]